MLLSALFAAFFLSLEPQPALAGSATLQAKSKQLSDMALIPSGPFFMGAPDQAADSNGK